MKLIKNHQINGANDRPVLMDIYHPDTTAAVPVVVFAHGFKGFKDWGCWHLIAESFVNQGFAFVKFNFSHNGTTADALTDFADLEAFGQNRYAYELTDLNQVLGWIMKAPPQYNFDLKQLTLIGHSRGGGISIVKAAQDSRIKKLVTWASVASLSRLWASETVKEQWQKDGVIYQSNARTGQEMPLYYTLVTDYENSYSMFDLEKATPHVSQPWLIIHGDADNAVPVSSAYQLHQLQPKAQVHIIAEANHVFGGKHPWTAADLPKHSIELVNATIAFCRT